MDADEIMLATDQGKLIRSVVGLIRIAGPTTQGVKRFDVGERECLVSAAKIGEEGE